MRSSRRPSPRPTPAFATGSGYADPSDRITAFWVFSTAVDAGRARRSRRPARRSRPAADAGASDERQRAERERAPAKRREGFPAELIAYAIAVCVLLGYVAFITGRIASGSGTGSDLAAIAGALVLGPVAAALGAKL